MMYEIVPVFHLSLTFDGLYLGFLKERTPWTPFPYKPLTLNDDETPSSLLSESPGYSVCYNLSLNAIQ